MTGHTAQACASTCTGYNTLTSQNIVLQILQDSTRLIHDLKRLMRPPPLYHSHPAQTSPTSGHPTNRQGRTSSHQQSRAYPASGIPHTLSPTRRQRKPNSHQCRVFSSGNHNQLLCTGRWSDIWKVISKLASTVFVLRQSPPSCPRYSRNHSQGTP